ncbi:hypothetical protein S7335_3507 [Synechococcus sp. PCC 7335]|nr:hypothetical protein S7335_3507 [Synechococcus sp. PCC 7335]
MVLQVIFFYKTMAMDRAIDFSLMQTYFGEITTTIEAGFWYALTNVY